MLNLYYILHRNVTRALLTFLDTTDQVKDNKTEENVETETEKKEGDIDFEEQKKDDKDSSTQSSESGSGSESGSSSETESKAKSDRKQSSSSRKNEVIDELINQFKSLERPNWKNVSLPLKSTTMVIGQFRVFRISVYFISIGTRGRS